MPKRKPKAKTVQTASPRVNGARLPGPAGQMQSLDFCGVLHRYVPGVLGLLDWAYPSCAARELSPEPSARKPGAFAGAKSSDSDLVVSAGQVTFDAEGNDDPSSQYFSRHIHWPGNDGSGVTLGRGYDMGDRTQPQVKTDLLSAGVPEKQAEECSKGAKKKGAAAAAFVKSNRKQCGEISRAQQKSLFESIYPKYVTRAQANYDNWTASEPTRVAWNDLSQPVRDILVDFVYQGFTKGSNPMKAGMHNDPQNLIKYIRGNETMKSYEGGRHRADYLEKIPSDPHASGTLGPLGVGDCANSMVVC